MLNDLVSANSNHPTLLEERDFVTENFDCFLDKIPPYKLLNQLYMLSRTCNIDEALFNAGRINVLCKIEEVQSNLLPFLTRVMHLNPVGKKIGKRESLYKFTPTDSQLDRLREMLNPEYLLLEKLKLDHSTAST